MNNRVLNLREMMITVILSILTGLVFMIWAPVYDAANLAVGGLGGEAVYGMWFIAATLTAYIIRKPGVALIAEVAAASAEALIGGRWGVATLVYGGLQGLLAELVFMAFGYRRFGAGVMMLAGAMAAVGSFVVGYIYGDLEELNTGLLLGMIAVRLLSGALLAGLLPKGLGDGLAKTGALNSYLIVRQNKSNPFSRQR